MKAITKHLLFAAVGLLLATACSNEPDEATASAKQGKPVEFNMTLAGVNSRTVTDTDASRTTTWVAGDAVGIFAFKRGDTATPIATNSKYVLTGEKWVPAAGSEIYAEAGQAYDYYAYYPYTEGVTDPSAVALAAKADQSAAGGADYGLSDVMASQNKTVAADAGNIPLLFKHLFAMVEVKVTGDLVTQKPASVVLKGVKLGSTLNLLSETPAAVTNAADGATDVTMYYLTKPANDDAVPFSYRAVVPAQTIAATTPLVAINSVNAANKNYEFQYSADVPYLAGKFRPINVNIGTPKPSIEIPKGDMTIDPWGESDAIAGGGSEVQVNLITVPLSTATLAAYKTNAEYNAAIPSSTSHWYAQQETPEIPFTASLLDDATYTKAIEFCHADPTSSWYRGSIGYHRAEPFETGFYKLTFVMKSSQAKGDLRIYIRSSSVSDSSTNWFFLSAVAQTGNVGVALPNAADTWCEQTLYFNFAKVTKSSGGTSLETDVKNSAELAGTPFNNLQVRFVPNKNATMTPRPTFTIADVKLLKVDVSEVPVPPVR